MIFALIDNGSLEPTAHRQLRKLAAALSTIIGAEVHAVSWKHSDRIPAEALDDTPAPTLESWLRKLTAISEWDFVFIPFFVSPQGAIGSFLRADVERWQHELGGFQFRFTPGIADSGALPQMVADRVRETVTARGLMKPPVIIVDHGGPSAASAILRNQVAAEVKHILGSSVGVLTAASLEGGEFSHSRPLFADLLASPGFDQGEIVVAPMFLAPGRHAGPRGDLAQTAAAAEDRGAAASARSRAALRCHFTALIGTHPHVVDVLAAAVTRTLSNLPAAA